MRGAYEIPKVTCPYCGAECEAEYVDIGVGMQQVTPHECFDCHAVEAGPYDGPRDDYDPETGWYKPQQKETDQ